MAVVWMGISKGIWQAGVMEQYAALACFCDGTLAKLHCGIDSDLLQKNGY